MYVDKTTGLLDTARQRRSPNHDRRPNDCEPELLVVHGISLPPGQFGGDAIDALFTNTLDRDEHPYFAAIADLTVSAHALIRRNGDIHQYVPFHLRAWHAGSSCWQGRSCCNDFSIGVELEGADDIAYTARQYRSLAALFLALQRTYPSLSAQRVAGHSDIAPGRKTDPGPAFDWTRLFAAILNAAVARAQASR